MKKTFIFILAIIVLNPNFLIADNTEDNPLSPVHRQSQIDRSVPSIKLTTQPIIKQPVELKEFKEPEEPPIDYSLTPSPVTEAINRREDERRSRTLWDNIGLNAAILFHGVEGVALGWVQTYDKILGREEGYLEGKAREETFVAIYKKMNADDKNRVVEVYHDFNKLTGVKNADNYQAAIKSVYRTSSYTTGQDFDVMYDKMYSFNLEKMMPQIQRFKAKKEWLNKWQEEYDKKAFQPEDVFDLLTWIAIIFFVIIIVTILIIWRPEMKKVNLNINPTQRLILGVFIPVVFILLCYGIINSFYDYYFEYEDNVWWLLTLAFIIIALFEFFWFKTRDNLRNPELKTTQASSESDQPYKQAIDDNRKEKRILAWYKYKSLIALFACFLELILYSLVGVAIGWKHSGGIIPLIILFVLMGYTWRAIIKYAKSKEPQVYAEPPQ